MSKELIQQILSQNSNSQDTVSKLTQQAALKKIKIEQGYAIFDSFGLVDCLISLHLVEDSFSANIKSYNRPTIVEEQKIRKVFEDMGYSIDFFL